MEPYFERDGISIYLGDCREVLPTLTEPVDLVLTDPPYGIGLQNHGITDGRRRDRDWTIVGDDDQHVGSAVLEEMRQRGYPVVVFASPMRPWPGEWRQHLVWDKGPAVGGGGDLSTCWKFTWELIQVARTGPLNGKRDTAVLRYWIGPQDSNDHPCQKPVALLEYLIQKTTQPGDVILDPFMGSGSTLRAAYNLGRRCIGIELKEEYAEIAARRLQQAVLPLGDIA